MSVFPTGPMAIAAPTEQMRELGADESELRKMSVTNVGIRQRLWGLQARTDPTVTYEEYTYWAKIEREMEAEEQRRYLAATAHLGVLGRIKNYFSTPNSYEHSVDASHATQGLEESKSWSEKDQKESATVDDGSASPIPPSSTHVFDAEWRTAARALRTAGWGTIFYLITTDILGWGSTPYVFSSTGYGQGVGIYLIMGLAAGVSGYMLWRIFIALDSSRFPVVSYGDPFLRLYGPTARHAMNVFQSLQQFCTVAVIVLGNASLISQLANAKICYVVAIMITMLIGMVSGLMRSLKHLGWLCNAAVWFNIISFIIICVAAVKYGPDPTVSVQTGVLDKAWLTTPAPVKTFVATPPAEYQQSSHDLFVAKFSGGINNMVYAYGGSYLFIAFLNEMRHPMDFWKAMVLAQTFITVVYVFFGAFVYSYYGQYAYSSVTQSVQPLNLQIVSNVLGLITALLAVFLYFNIGMKTIYLEVGQELLGLPAITTKKGRILWYALGPFYWILAFVVAASVPQFSAIVSFVGGFFGINFTYSFSALAFVSYIIHEGARQPGEGFDPRTGVTTRHDGGLRRIRRGILNKWYITIPVIIYTALGFAASGMGTWAAIKSLEAAFGDGGSILTSWGCTAPGG